MFLLYPLSSDIAFIDTQLSPVYTDNPLLVPNQITPLESTFVDVILEDVSPLLFEYVWNSFWAIELKKNKHNSNGKSILVAKLILPDRLLGDKDRKKENNTR